MNRVRFLRFLGSVGIACGFLLSACGGESTQKGDDDEGSAGESSGTGGSSAGTSSRGGSGGTGGVTTGGTGGTGIDGVCDEILPCGGDPEGSWMVRENCLEVLVTDIVEECPWVVGRASATVEGSFTFANGLVTQDIVVTSHVSAVIDDRCAQTLVGSDMITAGDLCPLLDATLMDDPETPLRCSLTTEGCQCEGAQAPMPSTGTDTFEIAGSQLIFGSGDVYDFCQEGSELHLHGYPVDPDTGYTFGLTLLLDRI